MAAKFEGPEKKLEIILGAPDPSIRSNGDGRWDRVVAASSARILSKFGNSRVDAYLLSESSLFVWDDRILMITCGKTTLIDVVPEIVSIAGRKNVEFVFYERKNFLYPHEQPSDFEEDAAYLSGFFPGKSYRLGPANDDHVHVFYYSSHGRKGPEKDVTLQLLMNDLDPRVMELFTRRRANNPEEAAKISGINSIYPHMQRNDRLFSPEGYSLNGIHGHSYFTIHVTPQREGSYVSFETNVVEENYGSIIETVVSIFRPRQFSLVFTHSWASGIPPLTSVPCDAAGNYRMMEKIMYEFDCGFGVLFMNKVMEGRGGG